MGMVSSKNGLGMFLFFHSGGRKEKEIDEFFIFFKGRGSLPRGSFIPVWVHPRAFLRYPSHEDLIMVMDDILSYESMTSLNIVVISTIPIHRGLIF